MLYLPTSRMWGMSLPTVTLFDLSVGLVRHWNMLGSSNLVDVDHDDGVLLLHPRTHVVLVVAIENLARLQSGPDDQNIGVPKVSEPESMFAEVPVKVLVPVLAKELTIPKMEPLSNIFLLFFTEHDNPLNW